MHFHISLVKNEEKFGSKLLKLLHSLHSLKNAAKICFDTVLVHFRPFKLKRLESAPRIFHETGMLVVCYVDELLIFSQNDGAILKFKMYLDQNFVTKDIGQLTHFLGI